MKAKIIAVALISCAAGAAGGVGYSRIVGNTSDAGAAARAAPSSRYRAESAPVPVTVAKVEVRDISATLQLTGNLLPRRRTILVSELDGVIDSIPNSRNNISFELDGLAGLIVCVTTGAIFADGGPGPAGYGTSPESEAALPQPKSGSWLSADVRVVIQSPSDVSASRITANGFGCFGSTTVRRQLLFQTGKGIVARQYNSTMTGWEFESLPTIINVYWI